MKLSYLLLSYIIFAAINAMTTAGCSTPSRGVTAANQSNPPLRLPASTIIGSSYSCAFDDRSKASGGLKLTFETAEGDSAHIKFDGAVGMLGNSSGDRLNDTNEFPVDVETQGLPVDPTGVLATEQSPNRRFAFLIKIKNGGLGVQQAVLETKSPLGKRFTFKFSCCVDAPNPIFAKGSWTCPDRSDRAKLNEIRGIVESPKLNDVQKVKRVRGVL